MDDGERRCADEKEDGNREWILKDAVCAVTGAAMEVRREWGPGFLEAVHQGALKNELEERKIPIAAQSSD